MKVEKWQGISNTKYTDYTDSNWQSLKDLSDQYRKDGFRTWLFPPELKTPKDYIRKTYQLTVLESPRAQLFQTMWSHRP